MGIQAICCPGANPENILPRADLVAVGHGIPEADGVGGRRRIVVRKYVEDDGGKRNRSSWRERNRISGPSKAVPIFTKALGDNTAKSVNTKNKDETIRKDRR